MTDPVTATAPTKAIELHVHSFSLRYHLRYRDITGYDVFEYLREVAGLGCTGVNISANGPGLRDLCGTTHPHLLSVRSVARDHGLVVELDTSDTREEHMSSLLHVAATVGADTLRTYTKYHGALEDVMRWTIRDLRAVAPLAAHLGILIVLENHEDFTGPVLAEILGAVDHPNVRGLYDYGNSQMVGEDPLAALAAMAPWIARVHAKDHVVLQGPAGPTVQGVPFGTGTLPVAETTERLYAAGVRRFCFENVWSYNAPILCPPDALPATPCFAWADPGRFLRGDDLPPEQAVREERAAFAEGFAAFRAMLVAGGFSWA